MPARHVPQRTCVVCRTVRPQRELLRVVTDAEGRLLLDLKRRLPGRGAYVCPQPECVRLALKRKSLDRALKQTVTAEAGAALEAAVADHLRTGVESEGPEGS